MNLLVRVETQLTLMIYAVVNKWDQRVMRKLKEEEELRLKEEILDEIATAMNGKEVPDALYDEIALASHENRLRDVKHELLRKIAALPPEKLD